jgi:lysophospholipase L1-like esterase
LRTKGDRDGAAAAGARYLLRSIAIAAVFALAGCLPGSGDDDSKSAGYQFGSGSGSNSSGKGDPMLGTVAGVASAAGNLIERATGSGKSDAPASSGKGDAAIRKSAALAEDNASAATALAAESARPAEVINDTPATVALGGFFRALSALEGGRSESAITILHLGDSHIAADRFSGDMREQFQSRFGNAGRGLMMPGMYLARGVKFDQGGKWQAGLSTGNVPGPYGITGVKISGTTRDDWLRLTATERPFSWTEITFQTGPDHGSALIALDGDVKVVPCHAPTPSWKTVRLDTQGREIVIRPKGDGMVTVHGVAIGDEKPGIRYVSLGIPGATAMTPLSWHPAQLAQDLERTSPDLVVIGYGTEESFDDDLNLRDYEAKVTRMLATLRQAAPRASLLVVGPPDVARLPNYAPGTARTSDVCRALSPQERASYSQRLRSGDPRLARWHPPLKLEGVRQALRRAAAANQAYFWDWSKMMGGTCGVHAWVHSEPALAAHDHIHLTEEGSKRSARLLFRELMIGYDAYDRAATAADSGWKPGLSQATTAAPPARKPAAVAR